MAKSDVTVLLVCSGRSEWDAAGRIEGRSDLALADGAVDVVRGAIARRTRLGGILPDLVLYWGEHGAKQTADVVSGQAACKAKSSDGLAPVSLGLWEGTLEDELMERTPKSFKRWLSDPSSVTAPEGETTGDFEERFVGVLGRVADKHKGKVVAVVLRPMEYGVAVGLLNAETTDGDEGDCEDSLVLSEHVLSSEGVKGLRSRMKVST